MSVLLAITALLAAVSAGFAVGSVRRSDPFLAFAGMTFMIVAAIPAAVHAGLSS